MSTLTDAEALAVIDLFTSEGGVFNTRRAGGVWQAQGVRGSTAATGQGNTLGEAVQTVCENLNYSVADGRARVSKSVDTEQGDSL